MKDFAQIDEIEDSTLEDLQRWGGDAELAAFEAVMWFSEVDPRLSSTTTSVLILDRVPEWERVLAGHEWLVRAVPRFRQRIVTPTLGLGNPRWSLDPPFHLRNHLRRRTLAAPGDDRALLDLAVTLSQQPFDRERSPWDATLVEGLDGGRAAYVLKLHHATADGLGIMQLLSKATSPTRETRTRRLLPEREPEPPATSLGLALDMVRSTVGDLPGLALETLRSTGSLVGSWLGDLGASRDYLQSAARVLGPSPASGTLPFRKRSLARRYDTIELPLADLKAAARRLDASLNDAFLAGLGGGFRRYFEEMGFPLQDVPVGFPISIRSASDPLGGNHFTGAQYAAPVSEPDLRKRVAHVRDFVRAMRAEPALDVTPKVLALASRLPSHVIAQMALGFTSGLDAQISNIPGVAEPIHIGGARITHFWPFAPVPGSGMMITMITHAGRCCIGIHTDCAAVTQPEILVRSLREGLDEVLRA